MSQESCVLRTTAGHAIPLKSVHVQAGIDGLVSRTVVRQRYHNDSDQPIEAVYTFPLPWGATLLGLHVELGGKRLTGTVIEKQEAQQRYEAAIDAGDAPVMVARSGRGLFTANLGNLLPQESAVIELEYAQLLRFEQSRVRLVIPTTVAPRYGDEHAVGGLAPHESAQADVLALYPLQLTVQVRGAMSKARIGCPSHAASVQRTDQGVEIALRQGALLDRDVIVLLDDLQDRSVAAHGTDGEHHAAVASFCPRVAAATASPLQMKILVDCSGSMQGDSIAQAREALHQVLLQMRPDDSASFTRFGSATHHVTPRLQRCTPSHVAKVLAPAVQGTQADMGGTELATALAQTFSLKLPQPELPAGVLLITDGEVWDVEAIIASAAASGHRIFAIGVGSAPAESLLREMAERTGGACEFVSPREDMRGAALRMVARMRAPTLTDVAMDWGVQPLWQGALPRQVFDGDTVHVFALLPCAPAERPSLSWTVGATPQRAVCEPVAADVQAPVVVRLLGACRLQEAPSRDERLRLALQYQLVSDETHLFLVHVRAEEEKARGLPMLQQVPQMLAAGWGGMGSVGEPRGVAHVAFAAAPDIRFLARADASVDLCATLTPSVWRTNRTQGTAKVDALASGALGDFEIPSFLRKQDSEPSLPEPALSPRDMIEHFNTFASLSTSFTDALAALRQARIHPSAQRLVKALAKDVGSLELAWALLLDWLSVHLAPGIVLDRHGARLLRSALAGLPADRKLEAHQRLDAALPALSASEWGVLRRGVLRTLLDRIS